MKSKLSESELNNLTEKIKGFNIETEVPVELFYHNHKITDEAFRIDILVEKTVVIELKSVSKITEVFTKQLGTYLKIGNYPCGLLINFNEVLLKDGIKRILNYSF